MQTSTSYPSGLGPFTAEENVARIRHVVETIWNAWDWEAAREFYTQDIVVHAFGSFSDIHGFAEWEETFEKLHAAFPDLHFAIENIFGADDRVAARWRFTGQHRGEFNGIPPTGRRIDVQQLTLIRLENGKAAELWPMPDLLGMMQQLGAKPPKAMLVVMRTIGRIRNRLHPLPPLAG